MGKTDSAPTVQVNEYTINLIEIPDTVPAQGRSAAKSLANVSCHERGKKYLTWQNASNAEPPPGIDERHLPARGKPILVSAIYFADGTLATALSPVGPQVDHRSLRRRSCVPARRVMST
jgi:hypothetical protein